MAKKHCKEKAAVRADAQRVVGMVEGLRVLPEKGETLSAADIRRRVASLTTDQENFLLAVVQRVERTQGVGSC